MEFPQQYDQTESGIIVPRKGRFILFEEDYDYYPTVDVDTSTRNESFIRQATVYRKMGIKNNAFILALVNQHLRGVDPLDPDLPTEMMFAIAYECSINPWYYFREIARAPATSGIGNSPIQANRGNIALWWSFFNHIMVFLIQIRQTGKSFSTDQLMVFLLLILCRNTSINLLTKDDSLRRENIKRIKDIIAELPAYLNQTTKDDARNGEEVTVMRLKNQYNTHVPQSSPKRALNMGRGLTTPVFHIDEAPFQANIEIALPAALAGTSAAVDQAKARGEPYGTILTTTAGKKDDKDGKFIHQMLEDAATWNEKFFDAKNAEALENMVRVNSRSRSFMVNITLNHRQLGKSDEWLHQKLDEVKATGEAADRDFFNVWTSGTQSSPFTAEMANKIRSSEMEIKYTYVDPHYGYLIRFYVEEDEVGHVLKNRKLILAQDPSDAAGGDDISFKLVDVETLRVIGAGNYNETNLFRLTNWICDFLVEFKNVTAIIERRSSGAAILDQLLWLLPQRGEDPFKRLFNFVVNDRLEQPDRFKEINVPIGRRSEEVYVKYKKTFGFSTSGSGATSREGLYGQTMNTGLRMAADRLHDKMLIDQLLGLEIRNGRIDHASGEHDDMVIAWLLCIWLLTQGTNLSHYGIDSRLAMSDVMAKNNESKEAMELRQKQDRLREEITGLCDRLADETDDFVSMRLEDQIRRVDREILLSAGEVRSIDELIRSAREKKVERARKRNMAGSTYQSGMYPQQYYGNQYGYQQSALSAQPWTGNDFINSRPR